ncbi:MAG: hypothetical protein LBS82_06290, partial [Spirochaetaceae bacterium]|nr:hypothetical protein [Spirochaetaceae bacterium]
MTVREVKNIVRKDVPIYYRRVYSGIAVVEFVGKSVEFPMDWVIETSPLGTKELSVTLCDKVDYPLLPLIKEIKAK